MKREKQIRQESGPGASHLPASAGTQTGGSWTSVWIFMVFAFGLSWFFWGIAISQARGWLNTPLPSFGLMILGGLGPLLAANIAAGLNGGWDGIRNLWRQLGRWRIGWIWYGVLLAIFAMRLVPLVVPVLAGHPLDWDSAGQTLAALPILFVFVAVLGGGLDEEMGWRGFALGQLQSLLSPVPANLLLGLAWTFWHVPLWFIPGSAQASASFPLYLVATVALSFVLGWVYNRTQQSLLLVVLAHSASNLGDNLRYSFLGFPNPSMDTWALDSVLAAVFAIWAVALVTRTRWTLGFTRIPIRGQGD